MKNPVPYKGKNLAESMENLLFILIEFVKEFIMSSSYEDDYIHYPDDEVVYKDID